MPPSSSESTFGPGNNETGDFTDKGRGIENVTDWLHNVAGHVRHLIYHEQNPHRRLRSFSWRGDHEGLIPQSRSVSDKPVLFIATDTPSMVSSFQAMFLNESLRIVYSPYLRLGAHAEGNGVLFGAQGAPRPTGQVCLQGWEATMTEMMILSHVDTLVAPRYSSFTQSVPLSLVFAKRNLTQASRLPADQRQGNASFHSPIPPGFCEMDQRANNMACFDTFMEWCCGGDVWQCVVKVPYFGADVREEVKGYIEPRAACPETPSLRIPRCLPFRWNQTAQATKST